MRYTIPILIAAALALTVGCATSCDTMAVGSVNVTVTDPDGALVPDVVVEYLVIDLDDADWQDCEAMGEDGEYVCGWEVSGDIDIQITADGFEPYAETITVDEDECHVIPELLDVELLPTT